MGSSRNVAVVLAILLLGCLFVYYSTREAAPVTSQTKTEQALVDTGALQTALRLAPLAATPDEQSAAHEAWRLADHEVDLMFASALREAQAEAVAAPPGGPLRQLSDRVAKLKDRVEADKKRVADAEKNGADDSDLAQAQLDLDQDELDNAQQNLSREGGDKRGKLQRLLQEHEASDKVADQAVKYGTPGPTGTFNEQIREWMAMRGYQQQLQDAALSEAAHARGLLEQHNSLEGQSPKQAETGATVERLRQLAGQQKKLSGLDQRIEDSKQLSTVYQRWAALAGARQRSVMHLMLRSLLAILGILLAGLLLNEAVGRAFHQKDRRRLHQLRMIARTALQVVTLLGVLLVIFGPPTQISTMVGLVTAALTVVMKDFIVAFLGWFTLMGKNGISVGDWVEIEGVSGEVVEIGVLKTVLLELGNWTEKGHPTGRRVSFSNSFAMERHFFNFSTTGLWLWDELQLTLPTEGNPYQTVQEIREIVERETQEDAAEAAADWERVTNTRGSREFAGAPAVSLRPGVQGLDVVVRYITRAPKRNALKSKLFRAIVDLLRNAKAVTPVDEEKHG